MAIIPHLQGLGARHLFTLSNVGTNVADDLGNSVDPTNITGGNYSFVTEPVCYGATHCLRSTTTTSTGTDGAIFANRQDINGNSGSSSFDWRTNQYTVMIWSRQSQIWNPTCIYEQGGGVNNIAFMGGGQTTFQAADSGQPFLIARGKALAQADRSKFLVGVWEYHNQHAGAGNRVLFYENGVLQEIVEDVGTDQFPGHSGDIVIGNSGDNLQSFGGTTFSSQSVAKDANFWATYNGIALTEAQCREIFERMVIGEHVISGTVAQQQSALDALSGTEFADVNCALEIRQATDATDYTLTLDNIRFVQNAALRDIAVKYVGPNTLTIINSNGSNAVEVATPSEQDLDGTTILPGGGTVEIVNEYELTIDGLIDGCIFVVYDDDAADPQELGTELQRNNAVVGTSQAFPFQSPKAGDAVVIVMIRAGYRLLQETVTLPAANSTYVVTPETETN